MIGGQRIQVGLSHAGKTAKVTMEADIYEIIVDPGSPSPAHHQPRHQTAQSIALPAGLTTVGSRGHWPGTACRGLHLKSSNCVRVGQRFFTIRNLQFAMESFGAEQIGTWRGAGSGAREPGVLASLGRGQNVGTRARPHRL